MLPVPTDRIAAGLRELDPPTRALLGISSRHGVEDDQIARLLGVGADELTARREAALGRLAASSALRGTFARAEVAEALGRLAPEDWSAGGLPGGAGRSQPAEAAPQEEARDEPATDGDAGGDDADQAEPERPRDGALAAIAAAPAGAVASAAAGAAISAETEPSPHEGVPDDRRSARRSEDDDRPAATGGQTDEPTGLTWAGGIVIALSVLVVAGVLVFSFTRGGDSGAPAPEPSAEGPAPAPAEPPPAPSDEPGEQAPEGPAERGAAQGEQGGRSGDEGAGEPRSEPAPPAARLRPLAPGAPGRGTVRLTEAGGNRLRLRVTGLPDPPGRYRVWLYNSVGDAIPIGRAQSGSFIRTLPTRGRLDDFRFVDISLEPSGAERVHSGQSVLRARTARLRGDGG